jgi:signal transduction histidine kinase/phage shock protein PspC (stress-responsive transcriptional regulator)
VTLDRADAPARHVVRLPEQGWLGGVCAGVGAYLGVAPVLLRVAFVILGCWRLTGVLAYFLVWLIVPLAPETPDAPGLEANTRAGLRTAPPPSRTSPVEWSQLVALALFGGGTLWLVQRFGWGLPGYWFLVATLASVGLGLVWWQADHASVGSIRASDAPLAWLAPLTAQWTTVLALSLGAAASMAAVSMTAMALPLGEGAVVGRTLAALGLVLLALAGLAAPWVLRVRRSLARARELQLIADARADMAAHLHDGVLQTLALIQKTAHDPREVTRLARRQERELRAWLYGGEVPHATLKSALTEACQEVEDTFPVNVELVTVGDADMTPRLGELVKAAREALVNAAKHSGASAVDVFAEVDDGRVEVFVRDRGAGFDPEQVPEGRLGIERSIMERMHRHGGAARLRSAPGTGTEVKLEMTP